MDSVASNPLFRVLVGAICLLTAQVGTSGALSADELFRDTAFAEGFGQARNLGVFDSSGNTPRLTGYRDIAPFQVYLIPEGPVRSGDTRTHPWEFEEGFHVDFVDESGKRVAELFEHRLAVNHTIETNTADSLQFAQFNKDKNLSAEMDDYRLDLFNIGWEGIGHWESECELSQMSLLGHLDQQSPSSTR